MNVYTHPTRISDLENNSPETLIERIKALKEKKQAVILAHNYQRPEIQDIADFVGDSLDLSRKAAETDARIIVFCGVYFMAEIAKILSPDKTVLLPDSDAGCPMADMITVEELQKLKLKHPGAAVVCYVNTHAAIKAESDICCTSANGVKVVNSIPAGQSIIFTPDKYLGDYIAKQTGRELILMNGFCPTHQTITVEGIRKLKREHPQAKVLVHPECSVNVVAYSDAAVSTNGMCQYVKESESKEFIIGTETGIIHRLKKENPDKQFYPASKRAVCPNMKLTTLEKVLWALEDEQYKIEVPTEIAIHAKGAIERMLYVL
ncbi:MAG: quinolinate synthase NadA [bacterium]|nr:quinolinate synthase NadA [bacterium]